jgi:DNA-binding MarR family transcriptional regulator
MGMQRFYYKESEDGELHDGVFYKIDNKRFKGNFSLIQEDGMFFLARCGLTGSDFRVLFVILANLEYGNLCYITQAYIAEVLNVKQPHVNTSIKKLTEKAILFKEDTKRGKCLRVNFAIVSKGRYSDKEFDQMYLRDSLALELANNIETDLPVLR